MNNNKKYNPYEVFEGVGVPVTLTDNNNFLKIKETLTRIGIASNEKGELYQSCHILHKRDLNGDSLYTIVHFKEMFKLDGKTSSINLEDTQRRNAIVDMLSDWGLLEIVDKETMKDGSFLSNTRIIPHKDKLNWKLISKYTFGNSK